MLKTMTSLYITVIIFIEYITTILTTLYRLVFEHIEAILKSTLVVPVSDALVLSQLSVLPQTPPPCIDNTVFVDCITDFLECIPVVLSQFFRIKYTSKDQRLLSVKEKNSNTKLEIVDAKGDGACGFRAWIMQVLRIVHGSLMPTEFTAKEEILILKTFLLRMVIILSKDARNNDYIHSLLLRYNSFEDYKNDLLRESFYARAEFELHLLTVLLSYIYPEVQLNIFSLYDHTIVCCSFSVSGVVTNVSANTHINIMHVNSPDHFQSILNIHDFRGTNISSCERLFLPR